MSGVSCEELTPEEQLILSEKARSIWFDEPCKLPVSFVKRLLHRLSGSVTLQLLRLPGLNLKEIEEDLDELMESLLKSHPEMESEEAAYLSLERLAINLDNNQLSQTFKDKWLTRFKRTTIQLSVDDNRRNTSEELTMEEINWLIQEQVNPKTEEQPLGENLQGKKTEEQPLGKTLQGKKTEEQPLGENLQGKKTEDQPLGKVLQGKKTEEQPLVETLQRKKTEEQPLDEILQGKKTEEQPLGENMQEKKTEEQPLGETLQGKKTEEQPLGETLQGKKTEEQTLGKILQGKKTEEQPLGETLQRKKTEEQPLDEIL